jgi:hypothetical protein
MLRARCRNPGTKRAGLAQPPKRVIARVLCRQSCNVLDSRPGDLRQLVLVDGP